MSQWWIVSNTSCLIVESLVLQRLFVSELLSFLCLLRDINGRRGLICLVVQCVIYAANGGRNFVMC